MSILITYITDFTLFQAAGVAGALLYAFGFGLVQYQVITGNGILYSLLNILAATLVIVSMIHEFNLAGFLNSAAFLVIGIAGVVLRLVRFGPMGARPAT